MWTSSHDENSSAAATVWKNFDWTKNKVSITAKITFLLTPYPNQNAIVTHFGSEQFLAHVLEPCRTLC